MLRRDREQHFHLSPDGPSRLGDIEIWVMPPEQEHNGRVWSVAFAPGTEIPNYPPGLLLRVVRWLRPTMAGVLARGSKARITTCVASLLVLAPLVEILGRLTALLWAPR